MIHAIFLFRIMLSFLSLSFYDIMNTINLWDLGNVVGCSEKKAFQNQLDCSERQAAVLDGMFLMTSKDLPWRQDALGGWDFYDISLSLEFQKAGYEIWIPQQPKPRCIHDCGYLNLTAYDEAWQAFLKVYRENLPDYGVLL